MNPKPLLGLVALAAIGLAACGTGGSDANPYSPSAAPPPTASATPRQPATASVTLADTALGKVVVDADGRTLYAFTNDTAGTSTCTDACATAWPAATLTAAPVAGPGVTATLSLVAAPDGGTMLKAGKWPLYRFAGDAAPGDTNGEGSGGVWFVVGADGSLVRS